MTLPAGTRLGHYEILGPLGAGGMGEVFRARDTRLGREVAIKVLPAALGSDPERLKRFEREARSASSLNHPNIVTIHEIGLAESVSYIAMELIEGRTLREVLFAGPLPIKRVLSIATQVAEGLARAHEAGILHRDLKPENLMVTKDGRVKILDFGLAKLTYTGGDSGQGTNLPTETGTDAGTILGTVGYMSPEQATGGSIDYRSDQFSFGSILYEMATGRRAFQRGSPPQTLTAIIQDEPEPIAGLNPRVPAPVRWIAERCLAKDPRNRYASTEDLARELATVHEHLSEATGAVGVSPELPAPARRWWIPAAIATAVLVAASVGAWHLQRSDYFWKSPLAGARYTRFTDWEGSEVDAAISPDGKFVAFLSDRAGPYDAWVGQVGGGEFLNLTKAQFPDFMSDTTRRVGFSRDGAHVWVSVPLPPEQRGPSRVWLVPTIGGTSRLFLPKGVEAAWSPDGSQIAYYFPPGDPIFISDHNGGNPRQIFTEKAGIHNHYVTWSPAGRFVYFVRGLPPNDMDVWRIRPAGGEAERLTNHHSRVAYPTLLDERTLIYSATREDGSGSGLYAMDVERRISHAVTSGVEEYTAVASSADGRRVVATVANPVRNLWTVPISDRVVDEAGVTRFALPTVRASAPRFGPEYLLYVSSKGGKDGLWKLESGSETELWKGSEGAVPFAPAVSPDGSQICFVVRGEKRSFLYVMSADGTDAHRLAETLDVSDVPSWSPDGKWIAVVANEERASPLFKVPTNGGSPVRLVEGVSRDPVWSPDGRFILYSEGRGGRVTLRAVTPDKQPVPMPEILVSYVGNRYRFLPNGKALVIQLAMQQVFGDDYWLLDLATGRQRRLTNLRPGFVMKSFDVSPDGKQILFDRYRENSDVVLIDLLQR